MSKIAVIGIAGQSVFLPVEKFHIGGETVEARDVHFEPGGKGFNQAVAAARYGASVSFLAAVGDDGYDSIQGFLTKEKITPVLVKKHGCTAFAAIITDASGANHVTVHQGVQLCPEDVEKFREYIKDADILLLNNEVPEAVNVKALEIARLYGIKIVLNPAPARVPCDFIKKGVTLFTPNEHETAGIEDRENVIVTLGKAGCEIKSEGKRIPAVNAGTVVDTTGAGDTFNGVLAAMLGDGHSLTDAAAEANLASGIGVTRKYAVSSIPTKSEIIQARRNKDAKAT